MKLKKVFRQQEPELVGLLETVHISELEQHYIGLQHSLQHPLPKDDIKPTKLDPLNSMVDAENSRRLAGDECSGPPSPMRRWTQAKQQTCSTSSKIALRLTTWSCESGLGSSTRSIIPHTLWW